jgi:hypothetical protein
MKNTTTTNKDELIQDLGRKARERLQNERRKRREIRRMPEDDTSAAAAAAAVAVAKLPSAATNPESKPNDIIVATDLSSIKGRNSALIDAVNVEAAAKKLLTKSIAKKRPRPSTNTGGKGNNDDTTTKEKSTIDRWIPDISHIQQPLSRDEKSNMVQLHGTPIGTTTQQIRKLFSGLDITRMMVLLPTPVHILTTRFMELDADYDTPARKCGLLVERYAHPQHCIRIFVQFPSISIATLAVQRSGEVLYLQQQPTITTDADGNNERDDDGSSNSTMPSRCITVGAAIAITHVTKRMATSMVRRLGIDIEPENTMEQTLATIQTSLDPVVSTIVWQDVMDDIHFRHDIDSGRTDHCDVHQHRPRCPSTLLCIRKQKSVSELQELRQRKKLLEDEMDRILNTVPFPSAEALDPTFFVSNPALKLTSHCIQIIQTSIDRINTTLAIATRWKVLKMYTKRGELVASNDDVVL